MSNSLRDQLLGLGYKPAAKPETPPRPAQRPARQGQAQAAGDQRPQRNAAPRSAADARGAQAPRKTTDPRDAQAPRSPTDPRDARRPQGPRKPHPARSANTPRTREEIDLGKAYALRAQKEKDDRIRAEQLKQDQARLRREAKAKLAELLKDKSLNDPEADIARHFEYGGKIKRIHVTAAQLQQLNAGALGVAQVDGRYLLVTGELLAQAEVIFAPAVALKVDPNAPAVDDPYADPAYQVPDDLIW